MDQSAQSQNVLLTETGSLLGSGLAKILLEKNYNVWGIGKTSPPKNILIHKNFTHLDIDLAQPIPQHLPEFTQIYHFLGESTQTLKKFTFGSYLTPASTNIINKAQKRDTFVNLFAPLMTHDGFYENIARDDNTRNNLKLFLMGDIYGPNDPLVNTAKTHPHTSRHHTSHFFYHNELTNLLTQAIIFDKVILNDEGLKTVFPTYIDDAITAIDHFLSSKDSKSIRTIVSDESITSLTAAYTIQKIARSTLDKELKLFFSGKERAETTQEAHPIIHPNSLGFSPKIHLEEGITKVFEFHKNKQETQIKTQSTINTHIHKNNTTVGIPLQKPSIKGIDKLLDYLPSYNFEYIKNIKYIAAFLIIIFVFFIGKTGLDIYLGSNYLKKAQSEALSGNFEDAQKNSLSAVKSFTAVGNKVNIIFTPISWLFPTNSKAINDSIKSVIAGSNAIYYFVQGASSLSDNLEFIVSPSSQIKALEIESPAINFKRSYIEANKALRFAKNAQSGNILSSQLNAAQKSYADLSNFSATSLEFISYLENLVAVSDKKSYLVLLQNNTELRPGGGFIGSFGILDFDGGKLTSVTVEDIYTIDGQLREEITPPIQLTEKLGVEQLYLRDSNWSTDFGVNAATARDFYKKETGKEVDGVIAVDLTFIQNLLSKIGPIYLEDYQEEINSENLFERGEFYSEVGFFPGSTQKKDFFSALTSALISKITQDLSNNDSSQSIPWADLIDVTQKALAGKHLLLSMDDEDLSSLIKTKGWSNAVPPVFFDPAIDTHGIRDFLAISEANLGANKVNRFIDREIEYEMTIGKDADLVAILKIKYTNNSLADTWPAGEYVNFLRIYTPFASSLESYKNGRSTDIDEVEVTQEGALNVFSTFVEVPIKSSKTVEFKYRIPKNIILEKAPSYNLFVSKQPGTGDDLFTFKFNLPQYIKMISVNSEEIVENNQNFISKTKLDQNRAFNIEVAKK